MSPVQRPWFSNTVLIGVITILIGLVADRINTERELENVRTRLINLEASQHDQMIVISMIRDVQLRWGDRITILEQRFVMQDRETDRQRRLRAAP